MPDINPLMNAVSELLYNRQHLDLHPHDRKMLEDAYLGVESDLSDAEEARDAPDRESWAEAQGEVRPTPKCEECGNDHNLYETIDARWDKNLKGWVLEARDDDGGRELDCLECDHRTPIEEPVFPYETVVR